MFKGKAIMALAAMLLHMVHCAAAEITVFAAASLTDALNEIAGEYQKESGDKIFFNFAASSILARQIQEGARADLFFSADEEKMEGLDKRKLLLAGTRGNVLRNSLVVIVPKDSPLVISSAADLRKCKRIALAETKTVPAGIYAREYLLTQKLWDELSPKVVPTDNVRAALAAVAGGNADAAVVYATDARISKEVKVALAIPPEDTPLITYTVAILAESRHRKAARAFWEYLLSPAAGKTFQKHGFALFPDKSK